MPRERKEGGEREQVCCSELFRREWPALVPENEQKAAMYTVSCKQEGSKKTCQ